MTEKYSVIVPSSGRDISLILTCLNSIKSQSLQAHKIYLVDDSKDQWIRSKDLMPGISLLKTGGEKRGGVARNVGIREAVLELEDSDFIFFLDDDDQWHPKKVQKQLDTVKAYGGNVDVIGSGYSYSIDDYKLLHKIKDVSHSILFDNCGMSPSTIGIKVSALTLIGGFSVGLKAWVGRDFFIKMYIYKLRVLKDTSKLVFQNQSHEHGRVSDQRTVRYETMYEVLKSFNKTLPKETRYMKLMVDQVIAKEKGETSIMLVIRYFPLALSCGVGALSHWAKVLLVEFRRVYSDNLQKLILLPGLRVRKK